MDNPNFVQLAAVDLFCSPPKDRRVAYSPLLDHFHQIFLLDPPVKRIVSRGDNLNSSISQLDLATGTL